jgi:hypothetical protein
MGISYMADATGQPLDKIEEDTDRDFFMTPEEAQEYGIIDEVSHALLSFVTSPFPRLIFPSFSCLVLYPLSVHPTTLAAG